VQQRIEKTQQHLPGVKCVVDSCYYHAAGNYCNAAKIEIQPPDARDTQDTDCVTFSEMQ
jgi:hypothetical protein